MITVAIRHGIDDNEAPSILRRIAPKRHANGVNPIEDEPTTDARAIGAPMVFPVLRIDLEPTKPRLRKELLLEGHRSVEKRNIARADARDDSVASRKV
ncbi:hypothetical protein, partial [Actinomyces sp.]